MLTETSFDTGEIIINVAESDTVGAPLVMLHGSTLNWQTFDELIPTLEQSWHIYACDSPRFHLCLPKGIGTMCGKVQAGSFLGSS